MEDAGELPAVRKWVERGRLQALAGLPARGFCSGEAEQDQSLDFHSFQIIFLQDIRHRPEKNLTMTQPEDPGQWSGGLPG
jgi:hypothetical protein